MKAREGESRPSPRTRSSSDLISNLFIHIIDIWQMAVQMATSLVRPDESFVCGAGRGRAAVAGGRVIAMTISGTWQVFAVGAFGGVLLEALRWWKLREAELLPSYAVSRIYWLITIVMIVLGGVLAVLHGTDARSAFLVVNLGASAPALIGAFSVKPPPPDQAPAGPGPDVHAAPPGPNAPAAPRSPSLRRFLAFGS
jgi:hypothetical protein